VPQMGRKQRLNARSDKRAQEAKSKAATKVRKMRVRFAAEVEIIYFEAEPSQAGPSNEAPPAPTDPEVPAELTDVSEAELWALSDEGSAEADAELRRRHEESSRWLQEHLDRLHGPRRERPAAGSWQEKMELDEAMDMYRRANMLDNEDERGPGFRWLSRGWKCYAFEAGACEPVLTWDERKGFSYSHDETRCAFQCCIAWDHVTLRRDLHPHTNRRHRGDPTFSIPVEDFGVFAANTDYLGWHTGCTRCRRMEDPPECSSRCGKRVARLPHRLPVYTHAGKVLC